MFADVTGSGIDSAVVDASTGGVDCASAEVSRVDLPCLALSSAYMRAAFGPRASVATFTRHVKN